ncbi:uncharacterized protein LOC124137695 isoform X2 [Haliotis rufescens]|uniref:uncharacterized protein LOC124137695 isoform X2 n=1 Tax=Haliotis rufescens TaxID=6454 RepID=UPI00201F1381|nr:uncharacterized protein LOC124137695 isoform X2 [Haliotis rufescens]
MMPGEQTVKATVEPAADSGELHLKKTVFLAYTDVTAAASRALLGINMRKEYYSLEVPEIANYKPACVRDAAPEPTEQNFQSIQVLNCKYEQFSVVVVNTHLPGDKCHYVARKIMNLCIEGKVEKMILLTSLHVDIEHNPDHAMLENTFNTSPVTSHPPIPGHTKICDPFLSTMIQMIQIEGMACNCLITPGYRVTSGKANTEDGTHQMICLFQHTLEELTNLRFDRQLSLDMLYRDSPDNEDDMVSLMYV